MTNLMSIVLFLVPLSLASSSILAAPSVFSKWKPIRVVNPEQLEYLRDSEDEKKIWVKPPPVGRMVNKSEIQKHPNIDLCPKLLQSLTDVVASADEMKSDISRLRRYDVRLIEQHDSIYRLNFQIESAIKKLEDRSQGRIYLGLARDALMAEVDTIDLSHRVDGCRKQCDEVFHLHFLAQDREKTTKKHVADFAAHQPQVSSQLDPLLSGIAENTKKIYNINRSRKLLVNHLNLSERLLFESYSKQSVLPGGAQKVSYSLKWVEQLEALKRLNPDLVIKPIPIRSLRLRSRLVPEKIDDFYLASQPVFISFKSNSDIFLDTGKVDKNTPFSYKALDVLAGEFGYSLSGACAILGKGFRQALKGKVRFLEDGNPMFGAMLTYSYKALLPQKIRGKVNYFRIYDALAYLRKNARFISVKDYSQWADESEFNGAFRLPAGVDPEIASLIKRELVNRVLAATTIPLSSKPTQPRNGTLQNRADSRCGSYICKLSGWDLYDNEKQIEIETYFRRTYDKWEDITFGEDNDLVAITDISLLN